jgi:hypothetical protein
MQHPLQSNTRMCARCCGLLNDPYDSHAPGAPADCPDRNGRVCVMLSHDSEQLRAQVLAGWDACVGRIGERARVEISDPSSYAWGVADRFNNRIGTITDIQLHRIDMKVRLSLQFDEPVTWDQQGRKPTPVFNFETHELVPLEPKPR